MKGSVQKMHLLDSCFYIIEQIDRQRKRPERTFLGFHLPQQLMSIHYIDAQSFILWQSKKKLQKSRNLVEK